MPSSNQYSSSHRPPTSAPPAPEWRVPAAPPRPPARGHSPSGLANPPPPPAPPLYNPSTGTYGPSYGPSTGGAGANTPPIPGFAGVNTATWGVNYNRQNHLHTPPPPPLPPRPSSATDHQSNVASPVVSSTNPYQPPAVAPSYGGQDYYQQWANDSSQAPQAPAVSAPAPPPPPPPPVDTTNYQSHVPPLTTGPQTQQTWNQSPPPTYPEIPPYNYYPPNTGFAQSPPPTHSNVPSNHYHPPLTVPSQSTPPPVQSPTGYYQDFNTQPAPYTSERPPSQSPAPAPPVPPKASPLIIPTAASVLGSGGPSDWEHLSPAPGNVDDVNAFKPRGDPPQRVGNELPTAIEAGTSGIGSNIHSSAPSLSNPDFGRPAASAESSQHHTTQSPISPGSRQDSHPPPPARMDTTGTEYTTASVIADSEHIDGIIEAWNKPILTDDRSSSIQYSPKVEPQPLSPQITLSPIGSAAKRSESTERAKTHVNQAGSANSSVSESVKKTESPRPPIRQVDRYEDLDSWSQSSLERYVAMLRTEAVADSDEERFRIFTTFMSKETKLREILYSIEHEAKADTKPVAEAVQQPAVAVTPAKGSEESKPKPDPDESGLIPVETEDYFKLTKSDDIEDDEDGTYSPGGRPILPRLHTPAPAALRRSASNPGGHKYSAGNSVAAHALRPSTVPPQLSEPQTLYSPLTTNPPQRIYTPFRYTEGPQRGSEKLEINRPAYQAYSALRQAQAESGRVMADSLAPATTEGNRTRSDSSTSIQKDPDETFIGLIRERSVNYRKKPPQTSTPPPLPPSLRQGKPPGPVEELRNVTSLPINKQSESLWHTTVRKDLEKFPNEFSFVRETFKPWEAASKARRQNLDHERVRRQEESESHIDALFNEKEIGYADINILEEEFRQSEARTQLEEERYELEDFIVNVFQPVDKRLEEEISTLQIHYDSALSQLDRENSNKEDGTDKHSISHTMNIVNEIHHRLEMRHHKRLEIALDRERRRKRAERRPLVFMGDSAALKKLDNDFDSMEKRNILEAAQVRDDRANKLMDLFDDAIMLGLGENQSILDDLSSKLDKIDETTIHTSGLPDAEIEQILKSVHSLVEYTRQDSESILHAFGIADSALNNADYSVSVGEARYANAEPEVFRQLEAEKKKEDAKIQDNIRDKLQSVRVGPAKITEAINAALRILGKAEFSADQPVPEAKDVIPASQLYDVSLPNPVRPASTIGIAARKMDGDPEHRERLRKALEDAKKRNAARLPAAVPEE